MHRVLAGKTGWGKSWYTQAITEANAPEYPLLAVLDPKDEYRGLVEAGHARHFIVGPHEADWPVDRWRAFFGENPAVILARFRLENEGWREASGRIIRAARDVAQQAGGGLIVVDEAHFQAPQTGGYPSATKGLATTGRGEQVSSLWATQRPAEIDETVLAQVDERILGGFTSDADLSKVSKFVDYNEAIHNPSLSTVSVPEPLQVDDEGIPLRQFTDDAGSTVGSEWIYSNDRGEVERRDTRDVNMRSTHYGPEGLPIADP